MKVVNLEDIRHGIRVANLSTDIGKKISLSKHSIDYLYLSGIFHDIGKAYINQSILNKPGSLTEREKFIIQEHPFLSYKEILNLGFPEEIAFNILYHHENYDGSGYPVGIKGDSIPIGARILKICDVFDALTMERPYRKKLEVKDALLIMDQEKQNYDPELYIIFKKYIISKYNYRNNRVLANERGVNQL